MANQTYTPHSTFQRLLFRDTLDDLFRCGDCGATLVSNLGLGRVRDGELIEVPCPQCKETWTFTRTLSQLSPRQHLSPA